MVHVLVATHGLLAEGLCSAAKVIMGPVEQIDYMGLTLEDSIEDYTEKLIRLCKEAKDDVLIFTDLQGASPYNASARAISEIKDKTIITLTGVNLPMLLEGLMKRETFEIEELADQLSEVGKQSINKLALSMYQG